MPAHQTTPVATHRQTRRPWRQVPIPPAIAALPREPRGMPIPYVAEWESGTHRAWADGPLRATATCDCTPGEGTADLGRICPDRQRRCMTERRCQVCSRRITTPSAVFISGFTSEPARTLLTEPPMHRACAAYAGEVCPGMLLPKWGGGPVAVATARSYGLAEQRITGVDPATGAPIEEFFDPADPGRHGTLMFYAALLAPGPVAELGAWLERNRLH